MSEFRRKLNEHIRHESLRQLLSIGVIVVIVGLFALLAAPNAGTVQERVGVAVRVAGVPAAYGDKAFLVIRLDSGEEVRAQIASVSQFRKGRTVRLSEQSSLFFGAPTYQFRGYVDNGN